MFERQRGDRRLPVLIARQNIDGTEIEFSNMLVEDSNNEQVSLSVLSCPATCRDLFLGGKLTRRRLSWLFPPRSCRTSTRCVTFIHCYSRNSWASRRRITTLAQPRSRLGDYRRSRIRSVLCEVSAAAGLLGFALESRGRAMNLAGMAHFFCSSRLCITLKSVRCDSSL